MNEFFEAAVAGLIVLFGSLVSSFAGGGASLVTFPALLAFTGGSYISLLIISKVGAAFMAGIAGRMHWKRSKMEWKLVFVLIGFGAIGLSVGTYILQYRFNEILFTRLLTGFIFITAFYLLASKEKGVSQKTRKNMRVHDYVGAGIFSFFINILNGIFGGTGLFTTAFLVVFCRMKFITAIGYTMMTYAVLSLAQSVYLMATEEFSWGAVAFASLGAALGGYAGTRLQYWKGNTWVRWSAIIVMFALGVKMLF